MSMAFILLSCLALAGEARKEVKEARVLLDRGEVELALGHAELGQQARGGDQVYAEALLRVGRVEEAATLATGPLLGEVLLAQGDLSGAALLVQDPELSEWIAARQGRLQAASTAPASWLLGEPLPATGDRAALMTEARLRAQGGDTENAARLTLKALSIQEDLPSLLLAIELLLALDQDALPLLGRAQELAVTPEDKQALAMLQADLAPNVQAEIEALEAAATLSSPPPAALLYRLSMAYEAAGRRPEAARAAVAAADAGDPVARRYVAERYRASGRPDLALLYED